MKISIKSYLKTLARDSCEREKEGERDLNIRWGQEEEQSKGISCKERRGRKKGKFKSQTKEK